jgi:hypothetical protein
MLAAVGRACARARYAQRRGFTRSGAARAAAAAEEDAGAVAAKRAAVAAASAALLAAAYALRPTTPPPRDPHQSGMDATVSNWRVLPCSLLRRSRFRLTVRRPRCLPGAPRRHRRRRAGATRTR